MAKRFLDSGIFRKPLVRSMKAPYKALYIYLLCECDHAGVWDVELDVASMRLGIKIDPDKALEELQGAAVSIEGGSKWWVADFCRDQYGELNPSNRVHASVLARLEALGIDPKEAPCKPLTSPLRGAKDMDKEKDKDNSGKERARAPEPDLIAPDAYADAWNEWLAHRRDIRKPMTIRAQRAQLNKFIGWTPERVIAAINNSIAGDYQGIFEPKQQHHGSATSQVRPEHLSAQDRLRMALEANALHHASIRDAGGGDGA